MRVTAPLRLMVAAALAIGIASPSFAADPGAVRACVEDNLVRYTQPDRSVVAQYVDIEAACRAALDGENGADFSLTPVGPGGPADAGPPGGPTPEPSRAGSSSPAPPPARADSPATASPPAARRRGPRSTAVGTSPDDAIKSTASAPGPLGAIPAWAIALLALGAAGGAASILADARRGGD